MRIITKITLLILFVLVLCLPGNGVYAFGAGNIPSFAYMEGRAFRHGDIEDTLAELIKKHAGSLGAMGGLFGKGNLRFKGIDVKRVYFGNWLRDYSQAVDIAGLQKLPLQTIINLCMVLGFLAHGYATNEFEVTMERLGVYLPTEHIDNPKGYGEGQDPRKFDARLRGPVDPRELEIDPRTGMKNYIANEDGTWDTSKALIRRTIEKCIHYGRQHRANDQKADLYESYRLLGTALHTLEDFAAHSNFCELSLYAMGYTDVFLHVGDNARIQAPDGRWVAPLVTGTFGSNDFLHSLLGEATDHISQASVTDLNADGTRASHNNRGRRAGLGSDSGSTFSLLTDLFTSIPGGGGSEMKSDLAQMNKIRSDTVSGATKPPDQLSPQEMHAQLWAILSLRDRIVKKISHTIEKIPGLGPLIETISDNVSVFVFTVLEPLLKPLMKTATTGLVAASGEVIDTSDQYEVFNSPTANDPTHSYLSKDHFNLILNEPAGHLAKIVVRYAVDLIVRAWDDTKMDVRAVTEDILQSLFHPDFHNKDSIVQRDMMKYMYTWINGLGTRQHSILGRLTKQAVRDHKNVRLGGEGGHGGADGSFGQNFGHQAQADIAGYLHHIPGVAQVQSFTNRSGDPSVPNVYAPSGGGQGTYASPYAPSGSSAYAPSYGGGGSGTGPSMPGLPTIPGLTLPGISSVGGMMREMPDQSISEPTYPGSSSTSVTYGARPEQSSSPYAPSYAPPAGGPQSSFTGMPQGSNVYAPSYSSPPPPGQEGFGFPSGHGHAFPGSGAGGDYTSQYPAAGGEGQYNPPPFEGQTPYGFSPPGFPGAQSGYGQYRQGGW